MKAVTLLLIMLFCTQCEASDQQSHSQEKRTDDTSLNSLEAVVQQQTAQIQALQAGLVAVQNENAALRTEVTTLKNKVGALSTTVAFTVRFSQDDGTHGIPIGTNSPLRFDRVDFNIGNGYDPQTGIFTVPVAGTYAFFLTQMGTGTLGALQLGIVNHGVILDLVYSKDHEDQGSSLVTTHLGAGEEVWVRHDYGAGVRGGWYTVFSGYLLRAD